MIRRRERKSGHGSKGGVARKRIDRRKQAIDRIEWVADVHERVLCDTHHIVSIARERVDLSGGRIHSDFMILIVHLAGSAGWY